MKQWATNFFNKAVSGSTGASVDEIYKFGMHCDAFVKADVYATYRKILIDVIERTHGIPDDVQKHLWDNVVASEAPEGLISLLVEGMYNRGEVFIVYKSDVMRKADPAEKEKIREDYKREGRSSTGTYLNFKSFDTTDLVKIFSALEYAVLKGLHKSVNLSRAIQLKISELRKSVALGDAQVAIDQAKSIASALRDGDDIIIDVGDEIVTATPDVTPAEKAIAFTNQKRAYYLGFPMSYISGEQTGGIGSTGEGDNRAIERGLKAFYYSIIKPALKAIFNIDTTFKSTDFREMGTALEALNTFELISPEILSTKAKNRIIARLLDLDFEQEEKDKAEELKSLPVARDIQTIEEG